MDTRVVHAHNGELYHIPCSLIKNIKHSLTTAMGTDLTEITLRTAWNNALPSTVGVVLDVDRVASRSRNIELNGAPGWIVRRSRGIPGRDGSV